MTIKELNELKEYFEAVVKDNDRRALRSDEEEQALELIDSEIARQSVTDEDVQRAIHSIKEHIQLHRLRNYPQLNIGHALDLAITALQQIQKEPCEYCKDGVYYDVLGSPCKYNNCPMCGRKLR